MKRILLLSVLIISIVAGGLGYWMYNKKNESLKGTAPAFSLPASELLKNYSTDETAADEQYQGEVILVNGTLKDIQQLTDSTAILVLGDESDDFGVSCSIDKNEIESVADVSIGQSLRIKGICTGYLLDVNLVRCVLL